MIEIKNIYVENYYSIKNISLNITNGIHLVKGINLDVPTMESVSNGAGKTSLFTSLYQGLYNKNIKNPSSINNIINVYSTNKPCVINIELNINNINYLIKNIRTKRKSNIEIYKNGVLIPEKGVNNNLKYINSLIGLDFNSFVALTFLNQQSLNSIIDMTNSENVLYQVFQLEKLNTVFEKTKARIKQLKIEIDMAENKISTIENAIDMLHQYSQESTLKYKNQLQKLIDYKANFKRNKDTSKLQIIDNLKNSIRSDKDILIMEKTKLKLLHNTCISLENGVCPTCGSSVSDLYEKNIIEYNTKKEELTRLAEKINTMVKQLKVYQDEVYKEESDYSKIIDEYTQQINDLKAKISVIEAKNKAFKDTVKKKESMLQELADIKNNLTLYTIEKEYLDGVIKVIRSGKILEYYLEKYKILLEHNLKFFSNFTSFGFSIQVSVKKGQMCYVFIEGDSIKDYQALSSGEKTRASLLILIATLKSMEQLLSVHINYLVFDELFGVLDEEGLEFIKKIILHLKKEKAIYVVNHHNELDEDIADDVIYIEKRNNFSTLRDSDGHT